MSSWSRKRTSTLGNRPLERQKLLSPVTRRKTQLAERTDVTSSGPADVGRRVASSAIENTTVTNSLQLPSRDICSGPRVGLSPLASGKGLIRLEVKGASPCRSAAGQKPSIGERHDLICSAPEADESDVYTTEWGDPGFALAFFGLAKVVCNWVPLLLKI